MRYISLVIPLLISIYEIGFVRYCLNKKKKAAACGVILLIIASILLPAAVIMVF